MKLWMSSYSVSEVLFSLFPFLFDFLAVRKSDHCPTRSVIFWMSPSESCIFLCLSGSCLLFSMCEGKKWAVVPSDLFVGVRRDDMVQEGIGFSPVGGRGRTREGACWFWGGGWNTDAPQVFAIKPYSKALPCFNICLLPIRSLELISSGSRGVQEKREAAQGPGWDICEELKRQIWQRWSICVFLATRRDELCHDLWLYADITYAYWTARKPNPENNSYLFWEKKDKNK